MIQLVLLVAGLMRPPNARKVSRPTCILSGTVPGGHRGRVKVIEPAAAFLLALAAGAGCARLQPLTTHPVTPAQTGPFQATYQRELLNPEVVIRNTSFAPIELALRGPTATNVVVSPQDTRTITVLPGDYRYSAEAGVVTVPVAARGPIKGTSGSQTFQLHYRYTWTFSVVSR